jgi:pantetheine-phosphate adenylyltransferase
MKAGGDRRLAVFPGSFDPITNGHIDIVERSLRIFDRVIVAVAFNPNKDSALFTPEERVDMIRKATKTDRVIADAFSGLLVEYAAQCGARVILRGLRAVADFEYEFQMALMNRHLRPDIETMFVMAGEAHFYTSSRLVKEVASLGGDIRGLVPPLVVRRLEQKFASLRAAGKPVRVSRARANRRKPRR